MSTQNVSNNGAANANAAALTTQDNRRDAAATAQSQRPGQGLWVEDRMERFPQIVKANPAEAKRLQKEINRLAGEIAKIYANPKGPKGTLTQRQQERIEFLERRLEVALQKLANLNGPESPRWPPICQPPVEGPFPMPTPWPPRCPTVPPDVVALGGSDKATSKIAGTLNDLESQMQSLLDNPKFNDDFNLQNEYQTLMRKSQRLQNLMDQITTTQTNREKSRHDTRMAVIRNMG